MSKTDNRKTDRDCGQRHAYLCEKPVPGVISLWCMAHFHWRLRSSFNLKQMRKVRSSCHYFYVNFHHGFLRRSKTAQNQKVSQTLLGSKEEKTSLLPMFLFIKIPFQTISNIGIWGYLLKWPIWGGFTRRGRLFQASGILKDRGYSYKVYKRFGKSAIAVSGALCGCEKHKKTVWFSDLFIA